MREIVFEYRGRERKGHILSSTNLEPHYHWCYLDDEITSLIKDDCIGFKAWNNQLFPTAIYTSHQDLVEAIRQVVERNISSK